MIGTAHWSGMFNFKPAVILAYYGGATLWVFDEGSWYVECKANSLAELNESLRVPWKNPENLKNIIAIKPLCCKCRGKTDGLQLVASKDFICEKCFEEFFKKI